MTLYSQRIMFENLLEIQFPRLLSQACRDRNSPFFGCFDRNWWHYRIRDFSSIILQQGAYTAYEYSKLAKYFQYSQELKNLAWGASKFWNKRACRRGAFEEYYPWEKGYPPLAFSTLATAKLVHEGLIEIAEIRPGFVKAAKQLENRFEYQAGNQQVAGLAAMAALRKADINLIQEKKYLELKEKTLALQNTEGWFSEYDGPDLGYLSVTMDCLWDLFDFTNDRDYLQSAELALDFLYAFIVRRKAGAGMHHARNTDYIVPYGICRFLESKTAETELKSSAILYYLYRNIENKSHFFYAIDDRYWSHYIGHSVVRAQQILNRIQKPRFNPEKAEAVDSKTFHNSGFIFKQLQKQNYSILISGKKGGIFSIYTDDLTLVSDYGWIVDTGKKQMVNHWWSDKWKIKETEKSVEIQGKLFPHAEKTSTPFLHFGLRVISFIFGRSITLFLRKVFIFKKKTSDCHFKRTIEFENDHVIVTDEIRGREVTYRTTRAPRASKRHVASADSWHQEDFQNLSLSDCKEKIKLSKDLITIETIFTLSEFKAQHSAKSTNS